jgi:tripartite-type tricarboxylate transporter receptor subunit TctC
MKMVRFATLMCSAAAMLFCAGFVYAQAYPNKLVRIVTSSPGNLSDTMARIVAQQLAKSLGQQVIVENHPGSIIPVELVAKAAPDGYTLLFVSDSFIGAPFMLEKRYDPLKDFSPVSLVALAPSILVVNAALPVRTVRDLIALAKSRPNPLNYGSSTNGSTSHTAMELFKVMAGVNMVRVPYRGNAEAISAAIAGEVQVLIQTVPLALPHIRSGKLKALAVTSAQPSPLVPELPTVAETLPGYEAQSLLGLVAPANTPIAIVSRLNQEIAKMLQSAEVKERLSTLGAQPVGNSPEQFAGVLNAAVNRLANIIKQTGLKLE